jgi:putative FmdB family regulatory protein
MPTYEYACRQCGEHLEVVQAFTEDALTTCPNCGGVLKKVFGNIGIVFKGSGFYKTDSRSGSSVSKSVDASSGSEAKAESKSDTKAETKSESSKPSKSDSKSDTKPEKKGDSKAAPSAPASSSSTPKAAAAS